MNKLAAASYMELSFYSVLITFLCWNKIPGIHSLTEERFIWLTDLEVSVHVCPVRMAANLLTAWKQRAREEAGKKSIFHRPAPITHVLQGGPTFTSPLTGLTLLRA